ncbi:MAG: calcium/sodium antiporter [Acidobacteriota bacterium]
MLFPLMLILAGIAGLYWGGEVLVTNAKRLAHHFGMSPMAIGLTVVAFATSAPELAAAITANLKGAQDLAVGNAVGSNIANVGLILGMTALFFVLPAAPRFIKRELAFMVVVTIMLYPVLLTGSVIGRLEGLGLFGLLVLFLWRLLVDPDHQQEYAEEAIEDVPLWRSGLGVFAGILLLVGGANMLVIGASDIAQQLGISERIIGLTLVAIGTSLPELAASLVAGRRGEVDMVMGNVVGSNIFNLLCILGITALIEPLAVAPGILQVDYWMMFGTSALLVVFLLTTRKLTRLEGAVLLLLYIGYTVFLFVGNA